MVVFKIMKLHKFTRGMNVDKEENLEGYNTNSSGRRRGIRKRDQDSVTKRAGGKPRV